MSIIKTALREYFWYGREVFQEKTLMFRDLVKNLEWEEWIEDSTFPTYDSLLEDFEQSSRKCSNYRVYFKPQDANSL
jgi:hypothetical protein